MRTTLLRTNAAVLLLLFLVPTAPAAIQTLAMMDVVVSSEISASVVAPVSDRFRIELLLAGHFVPLERDEMVSGGVNPQDCFAKDCALSAGKQLGVTHVGVLSLNRVGTLHILSVRIYNVATGDLEIVQSLDCSCPIETVLSTKLKELAVKLMPAVKPVISEPLPAGSRTTPQQQTTPPPGKVASGLEMRDTRIAIGVMAGYQGVTLPAMSWGTSDAGAYPYPVYKSSFVDGWHGGVRMSLYLNESFAITEAVTYNFYGVFDRETVGRTVWVWSNEWEETYMARTKLEDFNVCLDAHFTISEGLYFIAGGALSFAYHKTKIQVDSDPSIFGNLPGYFPYRDAGWNPQVAAAQENRYAVAVGIGLETDRTFGLEAKYFYRLAGSATSQIEPVLKVGNPEDLIAMVSVYVQIFQF